MLNRRAIVLLFLAVGLVAFAFFFDVVAALDFQRIKAEKDALVALRQAHPVAVPLAFGAVYLAAATLPLPLIGVLTLLAGVLFGFAAGFVLSAVLAALGATLGFGLARALGGRFVRRWLGEKHAGLQREVQRAGFLYAAAVRLLPVPFFIPGYLMGLTDMRASRFWLATQLGLLPMLAVLVNAGANIARVEAMEDVLSPRFLVALGLIAVLAIGARLMLRFSRPGRGPGQGG